MTGDLCNPQEWAERPLQHDRAAVLGRIAQRHEMALLHGILHHDPEQRLAIGIHDASPADFWVRGHIPGRPLMPGVVMIEISAQLCAWLGSFSAEIGGSFMGFAGIDDARFRGQVVPGDRLIVAARVLRLRRNIASFATQSWVGRELVFEAKIFGAKV